MIGVLQFMVKKQKTNKKWMYWLLMFVLFVMAAVIVYLVWNAYFKNKDEEQSLAPVPEIVEVEEREEPQKQDDIETPMKPEVVQYDGEDPNNSDELSGAITYTGVNDGRLIIRVNIDQYLNSGECKLDVRRGEVLIHEEVVEIVDSASTASCAGFDIPVELVGNGLADVEISLESGDKKGSIKGEIDI